MALVARGLYSNIMSVFVEVFVPRSNTDMHCLAGSVDIFQNIKARIDSYIQDIATITAGAEEGQDWSIPSYGTPIKVRSGSGLAPGSSSSSGNDDQKLSSKYNLKLEAAKAEVQGKRNWSFDPQTDFERKAGRFASLYIVI
ncbi:hypothetical protein BG015_000153 [Linnemannia schmuckeri]|uniref:Uncharacterized protein n=1 Tax=Linnemannia schmuckeri TaxID=64567 RepID=A0A9P5V7Y7_9FUNG|nr:hypothetical protein BG015_000153 [Linnemannia schmuckeri]